MRIDISVNEFADRVRRFDSCGLDWGQAYALGEFVEGLEADLGDDFGSVCIGDWAITTWSTSLDEINDEHGTEFESLDDLQDRISWDHLDGTATAAIDCGDSIVMVGVI